MNLNDKITIATGHQIKHTYVCKLRVPDHGAFHAGIFRVEWRNKGGSVSVRTLRYKDEGVRWLPGHIEPESLDADALVAAQALAGESPWQQPAIPIRRIVIWPAPESESPL